MFLAKKKSGRQKLGIFGTMFAACAMSFGISSFSQDFNYTGGVQAFTAPISATYRLEAWGAQGGWVGNYGGFGGYSKGDIYLSKGTTIYVVVGGKGGCMSTIHAGGSDSPSVEWEGKPGGYNGGGKGGDESSYWRNTYNFYYEGGAGGGGATHIARVNRGVLANYKNYQGEVLLVAGGGGGAGGWTRGGTGGGTTGGGSINCRDEPHNQTSGGTQSSGYAFGVGGPGGPGQSVANDLAMEGRGGGGGGWYGGYGGPEGEVNKHTTCGGGGGSGYIGSGISNGSMQNGTRGTTANKDAVNGFARITNICNEKGIEYKSTGDLAKHKKYTYCTDHGTDKNQNRKEYDENHVDKNNDGECDLCNQVYRDRGLLDLNCVVNGTVVYDIKEYGTANVWVDGRGTESGVTDYYQYTAAGTKYSIAIASVTDGYQCLGVESGQASGTMPNGDMSVYFKFGSKYTINFNGNGATSGSTASQERVYSDSVKPLSTNGFERKYYDFVGWNTKADGSGTGYSDKQSVNNLTSTVNGTVTLYAQWKDKDGYHNGVPIVYTITYTLYPKNGTKNIDIAFDPNEKLQTTYTIETKTFTLPILGDTSGNYSFEGWYGSGTNGTNGSNGVTIEQGSIGDLHFEADWLPTKDSSKGDGHDQNLPYVKTTEIKENKVKIAA